MKPLIEYINENADNKQLSALYKYIKQNQGEKDFAFESDFAEELNDIGVDLFNNKDAQKLL